MTADDALHDVLVRVAANRAAAATIERYTPLIRRLERVRFGPAAGGRSVALHDELIDACAGGDVVTAVEVTAPIWRSPGRPRVMTTGSPPCRSPRSTRYPLLFGPSPVHRLDRLTEHLGGAARLGQARGLQLRDRVRREQDPQAGVPRRRRAGEGLRHARLDRRRPVQPHPPGRRGRRPRRAAARADPGELGGLAGRGLRQGRQHPDQPSRRRGRAARQGRIRDRVQGELGEALREIEDRGGQPVRRSRPAPPTIRSAGSASPAGRRAGRAGARAGRLLRHDRRLLGDRQHPGRDGRRVRRARGGRRPAPPGARHRRLGEARRDPRADHPRSPATPPASSASSGS